MNKLKAIYHKLSADVTIVPVSLKDAYYPALDGLRGVAILIVLLAHVGFNRYVLPYHFYLNSNTGVQMFFVISGFLITTLLLKEKILTGTVSLKRFYLRRALRILPVAYLFLLALVILNQVYRLKIPAADFFAALLFYKNMPMANEPYTAHFWSLAVEEQFYLTFPLLLYLSTNKCLVLALSIILIVPLVAILNNCGLGVLINNLPGRLLAKLCMYIFWKGPLIILIGSVIAMLVFKGIIRPELIKANYFLSFILVVVAVIISLHTFAFYSKYASEYVSAWLIGLAIMLSVSRDDFLSWLLSNRILRRVGILSYSIYIWQELFIGVLPWQPWLHTFKGYPLWVLIIVKLVAITIIAMASFQFESIFLRIKKRYKLQLS